MSTTPSQRAAGESVEVAVAVADEMLDVGEELRIRLPAREDRDVVAGGERCVDRVPSKELCPAEDEQLHVRYLSIARPIASTPNASASAGTRSSALWMSGNASKSAGSLSGR